MADKSSLKLTIPTAFISALVAGGGVTMVDRIVPQKPVQAAVESSPAFIAFQEQMKGHCIQQDRDFLSQRAKDDTQDDHVESINAAVDMVNIGVSGIATDVQNLKTQISEVRQDTKELLRRQSWDTTQ